MAPAEAHGPDERAVFAGSMDGRTLYVVPYCMGPIDSRHCRVCGVEITDSPYVVANMRLMTRMGQPALERIEREGHFSSRVFTRPANWTRKSATSCISPKNSAFRVMVRATAAMHCLGKKCHALRIASYQARTEGWLAEHMLIVGIENPQGEVPLHRRGISLGLRQNQPGPADPARSLSRRRGWKVLDRR